MTFHFQGREYTSRFHPDDIRSCRAESALACTGLFFFLPIISIPESRFGRYWANQGIIILLFEVAALIAWLLIGGLLSLMAMIPAVGIFFRILRILFGIALILAVVFYIALPMSFAIRGRAKDVPFFGFMRFLT